VLSEVSLAIGHFADQQFLKGVLGRYLSRNGRRRVRFRMQELGNSTNLRVRQLKGRHAFLRPPISDNRADQIAMEIMTHQGRPNQIRPACAPRIPAVAKAARLLERTFSRSDIGFTLLLPYIVRVLSEQGNRKQNQDKLAHEKQYSAVLHRGQLS
jgi:hypothetical protein